MKIQPTASRTGLLLACPRPFSEEVDAESDLPQEPARYGSAFHQVLAACLRSKPKALLEKNAPRYAKEIDIAAKEYEVRGAAVELAGHVKSSVKVLRNWLTREKLEIVAVEVAYAVAPGIDNWTVREALPHDEDHHYDVDEGEVPGTIDLIARDANRRRLVVIDHKTGWEDEGFARPSTIPQMRTLGLVAAAEVPLGTELGIFHADRQGLPAIYAEPYEREDQRAHVHALRHALTLVGSGFMRTGPECTYCPVRSTCPAKKAEIISEGTAAVVAASVALAAEPIDPAKFGILAAPENGMTVEDRAGALYDLLKKLRALDKAGTEEIKRLVRGGAAIETREGKTLTLRKDSYETLSKKSIIDALGKVAGEKEIARLRKKGAMRETTRETLIGEK